MSNPPSMAVSRRGVLTAGAASAIIGSAPDARAEPQVVRTAPEPLRPISFEVNRQRRNLSLDRRSTLLDALHEHLHLTGTKKGCDHGQSGACTVIVEGPRINFCFSLAAMHTGDWITTIEGLGTPEKLHPMQAAFIKHDGYLCGYCTHGQICSAVGVLDEIRRGVPSHVQADLTASLRATGMEMRERMSGNICRCGAYSNIADLPQRGGRQGQSGEGLGHRRGWSVRCRRRDRQCSLQRHGGPRARLSTDAREISRPLAEGA